MKIIQRIVFIFLLISFYNVNANIYIEKNINWSLIKVIKYPINSKEYDIKIWASKNETELMDLMRKNNWITAINWVYFCPKDYIQCNWNTFTHNERYIRWEKIADFSSTWDRVVFWWDKEKNTFLFQTNKINQNKENDIFYWLGNFPLLLKDWENKVEDYRDLWLIDFKMKVKGTRNFICSDKENKNIYFWLVYDANIDDLAVVLNRLWCYNAINLDAWKSTAFIYNWWYKVWPWRNILDWVIITKKWINTFALKEQSVKITKTILKKLNNLELEKQISKIEKLNLDLSKLVKKIEEKYKSDNLELEKWEIVKNWFKININDNKVLAKIYTINSVNNNLLKIKNRLNELNKEEYINDFKFSIKVEF